MADPAPQWTIPLREQTSGLDHLGLGSVGNQQVLVRLLPDIYVQTVHPGYLSFYAFVLDEFWRRDDLPRTRASWRRFYRSKEVVFSVAANMCEHPDYDGDFGSIVGSKRTRDLADDPPSGGIATDFDYIKSPLGGYGLYYRSPMVAMGLVYPAPENGQRVDLPTERGHELAEAFRNRIAGTGYWKRRFRGERVSPGAVAAYGEVACPCRLRDGAPDLDGVRDIYLHGGSAATSAARRASLRMVLDLADQTAGTALDQATYRQLVYFGQSEDGAEWEPRSDLWQASGQLGIVDTWRRWRLYQAREFYAYGLDGLWRWLVDWGLDNDGDLRPIPIADAVAALRQSVDGGALEQELGIRLPRFGPQVKVAGAIRRLLRSAGEPEVAPADDPSWPDRHFDVSADLTEWSLYRATGWGAGEPEVVVSACLAMMMLVGARFDLPQLHLREDWAYAQLGGLQRLGLSGFVSGLRYRKDGGATVGDLAEWLLRDYVISQHLRVAAAKLPFDTYRFVREGDRLRFFDRSRPIGMNSARFDALLHGERHRIRWSAVFRRPSAYGRGPGAPGAWGLGPEAVKASGSGRINLAEELRGPWEHAVVITFSMDLAFFERAILPMLPQTRGRLVLGDAAHLLGYHAAAARERLVRWLNRGYLAGAIATPAAAHAKVILLLAPDKGRLLVGSGNLGLRGWASVGELFTRYEYSEGDESHLPAFAAARSMLDGLTAGHYLDDFASAYLQDIWTRAAWLEGDALTIPAGPVRHSLSTPLLDQLIVEVRAAGQPVEELVLLAPFHDKRCVALEALLRELQPVSAHLLVQPGQTSVDSRVLARLVKRYPNLSVRPFEAKGGLATEYVHAKMILAKTGGAAFCFQGSANLSEAALMRALPEGNLEANNLLIGERRQFDSVLKGLKIGKAVTDPRDLELDLRAEPPPDPGGAPGLRMLEARWEGTVLWIRVAGSRPAHASQEALVVVGTVPVRCRVLDWEEDASRRGQSTARLEVPTDAFPLFERAVSIWLYSGDRMPKGVVHEAELSNPVFCINQPALTAHLHGGTTANRIRELGWLSIAEDRELEDLIRALQGTMVFDKTTLINAWPPDREVGEEPDDAQLLVAYSSIDYAALRSNPRLNQYEVAIRGSAAKGLPIGPSDIQLALRSITDAFNGIVGRAGAGKGSVEVKAEWARVAEQSDGSGDQVEDVSRSEVVTSASEEELEADPSLEEESTRRWSEDARLRTHWRNFIRRFLQGTSSKAWRELVGPAVIAGNYLIFSHIMQRLHRQPWRDFSFLHFLLGAQAEAHGFWWGGAGHSKAWIDALDDTEWSYILNAFRGQHVAVRLVVDLAAAGSLTRAEEFDPWEELIEVRKAFRDVGRGALSHPAWRQLATSEPFLLEDATAIAADLAGAGELACWTEPPPPQQLIEDIRELLDFASDKEVVQAVARELDIPPSRLELQSVMLGDARLGILAEEIRGPADGALAQDAAARAMTVWSRMSSSSVLRLAIGRSRLLFDRDGGRMIWMPSLSADEEELPIHEGAAMPWDEALADLAARVPPVVEKVGS